MTRQELRAREAHLRRMLIAIVRRQGSMIVERAIYDDPEMADWVLYSEPMPDGRAIVVKAARRGDVAPLAAQDALPVSHAKH